MVILVCELEGGPTAVSLSTISEQIQDSEAGNSEYESADEEELGEEEEEENEEQRGEGIQIPGEEQDKHLDDDEDRKNPQYIPKKGTFYEHDDRTAADDDVIEISKAEIPQEQPELNNKKEIIKKVWKEDDKWHHDKFNETDQCPKSRDELVEVYGYDIRNEEGPPRARRRRRYGRGPNKYTRNWEDLDAYSKPTRGARGGRLLRGRGSSRNINSEEDFPPLSPYTKNDGTQENNPEHLDEEIKAYNAEIEARIPHETMGTMNNDRGYNNTSKNIENYNDNRYHESPRGGRNPRGRGNKNNPNKSNYARDRRMNDENYNRGRGNLNDHRGRGHPGYHGGYNHRSVDEVASDIKSMTISNSHHKDEPQFRGKNRNIIDNKKNSVPQGVHDNTNSSPRNNTAPGDGNVSRPKRYSSQRQRSVPDQSVSPFQHQGYYDNSVEPGFQNNMYDGNDQESTTEIGGTPNQLPIRGSPSFVPPAFTTSPPTYPPEPFLGSPSTPRIFPPVTHPPNIIMAPPAVGATPVSVPPPIAGVPAVVGPAGAPAAPPFLPPENMINYSAPPPAVQFPAPHPPPPPQFPPFQAFNSATQPQEIYSNGVTYYNTQSQQNAPRISASLRKRPNEAIPIVPPPDQKNGDEEYQYYESDNQSNLSTPVPDESQIVPSESSQSEEVVEEPVRDTQNGTEIEFSKPSDVETVSENNSITSVSPPTPVGVS